MAHDGIGTNRLARVGLMAALLLGATNIAAGAYPGQALSLMGDVSAGSAGSVLLGDFDATQDGQADLLVAAPGASRIYLVNALALATDASLLSAVSVPFVIDPPTTRLAFAAGDIDGDGIDDIVIGLPDAEPGGAVAIFWGRRAWPDTLNVLGEADLLLTLDEPGGRAGASLAFTHRSADTRGWDLIVGVPGVNQGSGAVFRIPVTALTADQPSPIDILDVLDRTWVNLGSSGARLGECVVRAGDLDGDGADDLAIGAPGAAQGGEVYLVPTSFVADDATDLETYPSFESFSPDAEAGTAIAAAGDLNDDGFDDLLVGAPSYGGGKVYLLEGGADLGFDQPMFNGRMSLSSASTGDRLGAALASVPDLDSDGRPECLVAAPGAENGRGVVGLFLSTGNLDAHDTIDDADLLFTGQDPGGAFGTALTGGGLGFVSAPGEPRDTAAGIIYGIDFTSLNTDNDGDTFSVLQGDCDDTDPATHPGADEVCDGKDNDCDGTVGIEELDDDGDGYPVCGDDCNDADPTIYPGADEACDGKDNDCDTVIPADEVDTDGDGYFTCVGETRDIDCDDRDATVYPGAPELCDGKDNDCDTIVPSDEIDNDGDGFYACPSQPGQSDCDDTNPDVYPGAPELCDGLDNDCDGRPSDVEQDDDGDGYAECEGDCLDDAATVYPGAGEICDGLDNDCDGVIPEDEADPDGDGYFACTSDTQPEADCDDTNPDVHPGAPELCDGLDNDCDGAADPDLDEDGYRDCDDPDIRDCDDSDPEIHPGATERCNGVDDDCDGAIPEVESDGDSDGYRLCADAGDPDCDDSDPSTYPGADEACDGKDNDCDGIVPDNESDDDGDGYRICNGDCDDTSPVTYPGAEEICDGLDNDCNGEPATTENEDRDSDGYTACGGDCDDGNPRINPDAEEVFDGRDNDCNGTVDDVPCVDHDGDGYPQSECVGSGDLDCNDFDPDVYPNAPEGVRVGGPGSPLQGDGKDNDCDGVVDEGTTLYDDDQDGWTEAAGDCDDTDPDVSPSAIEILGDDIDNDCDGATDYDDPRIDNDGDGYANEDAAGNTLDCDDADQTINPGASEGDTCNGVDDNCNGTVDEGLSCTDDDGDGYSEDDGDCNDALANVYPGADEVADGLDNDCDGTTDVMSTFDGPGIGCGAMADAGGVAFSCNTGPGHGSPTSGGSLILLVAVAGLAVRRRNP